MKRFFLKNKKIIFLLSVFFIGFSLLIGWGKNNNSSISKGNPILIPTNIMDKNKLEDNLNLYKEEDRFKVYEVYLTVYTGLDSKSGIEFDFSSLNEIEGREFDPELKANIFVIDLETGEVIAGEQNNSIPNATIELRGQSARNYPQKSYKINFSKQTRLFQGQRKLNLNKHISDDTRIIQKFAFDSMIGLPNFTSIRTNFMNVKIKDGTKEESEYVDYGLFTHIENVDNDYLTVRSLNENATFLKPVDFAFTLEEAQQVQSKVNAEFILRDVNQPGEDKLLKMVSAINEKGTTFDANFKQYFDRDNYLTWIALNLLLNNYDTMSRNFLLYSPSNVNKWYFLPWDYDVSMIHPSEWESSEYSKWFGLQRYWGASLHRKFFQNPENLMDLNKKIDILYQRLLADSLEERVEKYAEIYEKYVINSEIDRLYLENEKRINLIDTMGKIRGIRDILTYNYETYYDRLEAPMPFYLYDITNKSNIIKMNWEDAVDLQNDIITYEISIFTNPDEPLKSQVWSAQTEAVYVEARNIELEDGVYYWQVVASDDEGHEQVSFDRCEVGPGYKKLVRFGMKKFTLENNVIKEVANNGVE